MAMGTIGVFGRDA